MTTPSITELREAREAAYSAAELIAEARRRWPDNLIDISDFETPPRKMNGEWLAYLLAIALDGTRDRLERAEKALAEERKENEVLREAVVFARRDFDLIAGGQELLDRAISDGDSETELRFRVKEDLGIANNASKRLTALLEPTT